jgi:hypothetical protein
MVTDQPNEMHVFDSFFYFISNLVFLETTNLIFKLNTKTDEQDQAN